MTESGIYLIRNTKNHKVYIGSSANLKRRKGDHFYKLRKEKQKIYGFIQRHPGLGDVV